MATPFLGEIKLISFNFAPKGWALCNGQLLPINQNQALFSILGTTYGGDGRVNFALPNLRGRVPMHVGLGRSLGERAGEDAHTLIAQELPAHVHQLRATFSNAATNVPTGTLLAVGTTDVYASGDADLVLASDAVGMTGGSQPHENRQPFLVLNFVIALQGVFPPHS